MTHRRSIVAVLMGGLFFTPSLAAQEQEREIPAELSEHQREMLRVRIDRIMDKDQQFRDMLSYSTTDLDELKRIDALPPKEMMAAMADDSRKLAPEIRKLLVDLQQRNDQQNLEEFEEIVREYGYPSAERLGTKSVGLFVILLHPPVPLEEIEAHTERMSALLLPEVHAGRMKPRLYATFIDNMLAKILRKPQIYGTNQQFDPATKTVLPPVIEDLGKANAARRAIGMPELQEGEYRLRTKAPTKS